MKHCEAFGAQLSSAAIHTCVSITPPPASPPPRLPHVIASSMCAIQEDLVAYSFKICQWVYVNANFLKFCCA